VITAKQCEDNRLITFKGRIINWRYSYYRTNTTSGNNRTETWIRVITASIGCTGQAVIDRDWTTSIVLLA